MGKGAVKRKLISHFFRGEGGREEFATWEGKAFLCFVQHNRVRTLTIISFNKDKDCIKTKYRTK